MKWLSCRGRCDRQKVANFIRASDLGLIVAYMPGWLMAMQVLDSRLPAIRQSGLIKVKVMSILVSYLHSRRRVGHLS